MAKDLADEILSAIGENDEQQEVTVWLDTGFPPLNYAIGGAYNRGLPGGRIVEMFGPPSSGKTAIATNAMKSAQQQGGIACFMDHENSFDVGLAVGLGLDVTPGRYVYKAPTTFEESVDMAVKLAKVVREKKLIQPEAPILVVFDSLASMIPQSKFADNKGNERDTSSYGMHDNTALARCTSSAFPVLAQFCQKLNMTMLFLNQEREKPGVAYGDPTTTPGGKAPEFYASVRIKLSRSMLKDKASGEVQGQDIKAVCRKNKVNRPFLEATWRFTFQEDGTGKFDVAFSLVEHMKDKGLFELAGNYIVWEGKKYYPAAFAKKVEDEGLIPELVKMLEAKS